MSSLVSVINHLIINGGMVSRLLMVI